jgi:hypothetical protein
MSKRPEKTWQFGSTTASLLVAYLLVLQGFGVGFSIGSRTGQVGLFASAICQNSDKQRADTVPGLPAPSRGHADKCCVFHFSGAGVAPAYVAGTTPTSSGFALAAWTAEKTREPSHRSTLPVGSRAPPSIYL